jgi:hypothetical protein
VRRKVTVYRAGHSPHDGRTARLIRSLGTDAVDIDIDIDIGVADARARVTAVLFYSYIKQDVQ